MNKVIFVPSIQHTGTWFTINFLKHFIPESREVHQLMQERKRLDYDVVLHTHFPIISQIDMRVDMDWHSRRQLTMKDRSLDLRGIELLCNLFPTVIPVRDPVAAILTREVRHPDLRHFFIVDGFIELAQNFMHHPNVKFLPIDLRWNRTQRIDKLVEILEHCDIDPTPHSEWLYEFAERWIPQNATPQNGYKELYKERDTEKIRFLLGPKWAEMTYFQNTASVTFEFLTSVGYTRRDIGI